MLEKARIIRQATEERSFHIFYQLLSSAPSDLKEKLLITESTKHNYLSGGVIEVPGLDEKQAFQETTEAMSIMGISEDDQQGNLFLSCLDSALCSDGKIKSNFSFLISAIFRILSAVLHLGNLEFKQERTTDQATLPNQNGMLTESNLNRCKLRRQIIIIYSRL